MTHEGWFVIKQKKSVKTKPDIYGSPLFRWGLEYTDSIPLRRFHTLLPKE